MRHDITIFGVKSTTEEIIRYLTKRGFKISLIVSISPEELHKYHISGYKDLEPVAKEIGAEYKTITDYSLRDSEFFKENQFGIGIAVGWQRIIPQDVLDCFGHGVFGFHGSSFELPKGKGRSPMNWSIIEDRKRILNHLFKYQSAVDAGNIFSVSEFEINPFDTILTLQYKSLITMKRELDKLLVNYKNDSIVLSSQHGTSTFYPKRTPEDGRIDFNKTTIEIHNLIRAVTKPFPGAFFSIDEKKFTVWRAQPFDNFLDFSDYKPGEIIENMYGMMLIKTGDGALLITEFELENEDMKEKS